MTNATNTAKAIMDDIAANSPDLRAATSKSEALTIIADSGTAFQYKAKTGAEIRHCNCQCGLQVVGKAIYRPGHDAKHVSELVIEILDALDAGKGRSFQKMVRAALEALPSIKLQVKLAGRLGKSLGEDENRINQVQALLELVIEEADEEGDE